MAFYLSCLKDYSKKHQLQIHAWVLMTNHIHLPCAPNTEGAVSKTMQDVGNTTLTKTTKEQVLCGKVDMNQIWYRQNIIYWHFIAILN